MKKLVRYAGSEKAVSLAQPDQPLLRAIIARQKKAMTLSEIASDLKQPIDLVRGIVLASLSRRSA